jgi:hypothetical protein
MRQEGTSIMRTIVTFEGNLADDPRVRFTPSGKQITEITEIPEITVLVNQRRQNGDSQWVDGEPTRLRWATTGVIKTTRSQATDQVGANGQGHVV